MLCETLSYSTFLYYGKPIVGLLLGIYKSSTGYLSIVILFIDKTWHPHTHFIATLAPFRLTTIPFLTIPQQRL